MPGYFSSDSLEGVPDPTFVFCRHVEAQCSVHVPLLLLGIFTPASWAVEVSVLFGVHVSLVSSEGVEDAVVVHSASAWQGDGEFWFDDCPRLPGSVFSGYSLSGSCLFHGDSQLV